MTSSPSITSLHCYPIKSCRGIELDEGLVERRGFALDRRFMVVDDTGTFRSQRKDPRLALVEVAVRDGHLVVTADGHGSASIELDAAARGPIVDARVWRHDGPAVDQGDEVAAWFSDLLGAPSRLVHMADDMRRPVNPKHATSDEDIVGFADGYPFLVASTSSLADLQRHMDEHVPIDRFRANVVVDGTAPWAEDEWRSLRVGDVEFTVAKACTRCAITTTDQRSGERFSEPLRTLGKRRRTDDGVTFGTYVIPRTVGGRLRVGDAVAAT